VPWPFEPLEVRHLDPYDFVLSKLARWREHDREDVRRVAAKLDLARLRAMVREALPLYVGDDRWVRAS
jgi:hypothetical protein